MERYKLLLFLLIFSFAQAQAQTNRYFVYFKDKAGTPYSISNPSQFLSERSIGRKQRDGISIVEEDLPANPSYVQQVKSTGVNTFFTSRWWNGVLIETDASTISSVQSLPFVKSVLYVAPGKRLTSGRVSEVRQKRNVEAAEPVNNIQLKQIGIDVMHSESFRGEGVLIAIFDSGFTGVNVTQPFATLRNDNRIRQTFNFVNNTQSVFQNDSHGTEVLSVMAAFTDGVYTGGAYKADYCLYVTEDVPTEYRIEEFNWTFAAERADSAGVDVINSSLGYYDFDDAAMNYEKSQLDGKTAVITQAARKAIEKGMIVVCSAGNEGGNSWQTVTAPADADGILAAGSITSGYTLSTFSSKGPTADGRIKPDVVAMGSGTSVVRANGSLGTSSGTSLSSPLIASLAAGVRQAYPSLTSKEVYNAIIGSADQSLKPDNLKGYGVPHFTAIRNYIESIQIIEAVSVYPNPVSDNSLFIRLKTLEDSAIQIRILDAQGRRVQELNYPNNWFNNPIEYDISNLYTGLYFMQLQVGDKTSTIKFVRQ